VIIAVVLVLKPSREYLKKNSVIITYMVVYLLSIIVVRHIWQHDTMGTRLTAPIYPYLLLLIISLVYYSYNKIKVPKVKQVIYRAGIAVFAIIMIIQMSSSLLFYISARHGQGYNSPSWRNEQGINWLEDNVAGNAIIYSDVAEGVGFLIKKPVRYLPQSGDEKAIDDIIAQSFIICFKGVYHRPYLLSNKELAEYGVLEIIADYPTSTIWKYNYNCNYSYINIVRW